MLLGNTTLCIINRSRKTTAVKLPIELQLMQTDLLGKENHSLYISMTSKG